MDILKDSKENLNNRIQAARLLKNFAEKVPIHIVDHIADVWPVLQEHLQPSVANEVRV